MIDQSNTWGSGMNLQKLSLVLLLVTIYSNTALGKNFSVLSYNVENLFDTTHDTDKDDYTYLPLEEKRNNPEVYKYCRSIQVPTWRNECYQLDWTEEVVSAKIEKISEVIKAYDGRTLPDIVILQEVENIGILRRLNTEGGLNYATAVLIEGGDKRGIDVGILSKFPISGTPKLHYIDPDRRISTRGILEVKLLVDDKIVAVFANHWPSQNNPAEFRALAAKTLLKASSSVRADIRIAGGDFNTVKNDSPHSIDDYLTHPRRGIYFVETNPNFEWNGAEGSHWYGGHWNYLDRLFIDSKSIHNGVTVDYKLHVKDFMLAEKTYRRRGQTRKALVPFRFSPENLDGYSDHLPVSIKVHIP